jgi:hypothetical protein
VVSSDLTITAPTAKATVKIWNGDMVMLLGMGNNYSCLQGNVNLLSLVVVEWVFLVWWRTVVLLVLVVAFCSFRFWCL